MQRVEANADWSLFCPNEAPGLADVWGQQFVTLYNQYERQGRAKRTIKAQQLWFAILEAQVSGSQGPCRAVSTATPLHHACGCKMHRDNKSSSARSSSIQKCP